MTTVGVMPVFLLGALSVQVRADLGIGEAGIGTAVLTFFAVSAVASTPAGRLVQRHGSRRGILATVLLGTVSLGWLGVATRSLAGAAGALALGGLANAVAQPAANLLLVRHLRPGRRGLAFGVKQSAIPVASLLGGLAVPVVALTFGWRWVFVGLAVAVPLLLRWLPAGERPAAGPVAPRGAGRARLTSRPLLLLALVMCGGAAVGNSAAAFLVQALVAGGMGEGRAGALLALASGAAIIGRVVVGWQADRRDGDHLGVVGGMLVAGALGFAGLAVAGAGPALLVATLAAFGAGWAFTGLVNLQVVTTWHDAPAAATGVTQSGIFLGGTAGPLAFGWVAEHASYALAWWGAALLLAATAGLVVLARRELPAPVAQDVA